MVVAAIIGGLLVAVGLWFVVYKPNIETLDTGSVVLWYTPTNDRGAREMIILKA